MSLKTDYKDDILAVGNLRKYQMIQNNDGTVSFQDVTQYAQTGDVFGAGDINKTNQAVNEKFDSGDVVDPMLATEPGFAADALAVKNQLDEQNKNFNYVDNEIMIGEFLEKPLYRKCIANNVTISDSSAIPMNTNVETVFKIYGVGTDNTNTTITTGYSDTANSKFSFRFNGTDSIVPVIILGGTTNSLSNCYVFVEYTKP